MDAAPCIAIVDDDPGQRQLLDNAMQRAGYRTRRCENGEQALEAAPDCDLMLLDVRMPGMSGLDVLEKLKQDASSPIVILLTAFIDVRDAVAAIKTGALDYLEKPVDLDELIVAVDDALGKTGRAMSTTGRPSVELPEGVVVESEAMRRVFEQAAQVAPTEASVLILGESGTGKEVVARFIHSASKRSGRPMATIDCAALPEKITESLLFGHEKGAFTGADTARVGRFEEADGGTLLLDEIGELPLGLQPKLLRVLETGTFRRIGGSKDIHADVRVLAATNRDLETAVKQGEFREDLFYRINVVMLALPPLRERKDDILPLADYLRNATKNGLRRLRNGR